MNLRRGLDVMPKRGTVIGHDGAQPVRTPYDDCVLIMPSRWLGPGLTAVRPRPVRRLTRPRRAPEPPFAEPRALAALSKAAAAARERR